MPSLVPDHVQDPARRPRADRLESSNEFPDVFQSATREPGGAVTRARAPGILVVDDDRVVRALLNVLLNRHGCVVWLTADGYQALKVYEGHRQDIDLVFLDVHMAGLDGPHTLTALRQLNPQLRCCFMSGDIT